MTKSGYIVGMANETNSLKQNNQIVPLWGLVSKFMVKIYGEKNIAIQQQGGTTKLESLSRNTYNLYGRHTITIPTPDWVDRKIFDKPQLTIVSPEGEEIISQYLELAVKLNFIDWKQSRKDRNMEYYEN